MRRAEELLNLPVRVRGIELGRPVDLILDSAGSRAVGFEIRCGDGVHRFLPFAAAALVDGAIELESPFVLLDFGQVSFYREQGTTLRARGRIDELWVGPDGTVEDAVAAPCR